MRKQFLIFLSFLVKAVLGSDGPCNAPICSACALMKSAHHFCAMVTDSKCCEEYNSAHHFTEKTIQEEEKKEERNFEAGMQLSVPDIVAICVVAIILTFLTVNATKLFKLVSKERAFKKLESENMEILL